ncbi:MAG: hypothetical protein R3C11_01865 [Planctomycetaceae bacterium]
MPASSIALRLFKLMSILWALSVLGSQPVTQAAEPFVSGIPIDEPIDTFNVRAITGPSQGKTLCYACQYGGKPVIAVFFKEVNVEVIELLKEVNETTHSFENKKLRAFGIYLTDEPEVAAAELEKLSQAHSFENLPLTVYDGESGPLNYEIKEEAQVNVMMWVKARVKANHAYRSGKELTREERSRILMDTEKILPQG